MTNHVSVFLAKLSGFGSGYAYRGQEQAGWELESSALRRLNKAEFARILISSPRAAGMLARYHRDELIDPARTAGFGFEDGREISDLELLAKLQHFGAATALLDFTWNPLVALWFACQPAKKKKKTEKATDREIEKESDEETEVETPGKVFAVNLNSQQNFLRIPYEETKEEKRLEKLLAPEESNLPLYWEPIVNETALARIIGQSSVFVIGRPFIPTHAFQKIEIDADHKKLIRKELEENLGISDLTLYRDVHGFARTNGVDAPIRRMYNPEKHLYQGNRLYQQGNVQGAVSYYDRCLEQGGDIGEFYLLRANAKAALGDHPLALNDYDKAAGCERLFLDESPATNQRRKEYYRTLFFNRGNSKAVLDDFAGAEADFGESRQYCPTPYWLVRSTFNRANMRARLRQLKEASEDYMNVIRQGGSGLEVPFGYAQFNLGNVLMMLGRVDEAKRAFREAVKSSMPNTQATANLASVERVISHIGESEIKAVTRSPDSATHDAIMEVRITTKSRGQQFSSVGFAGNVGNIGNTGSTDPLGLVGLPGGQGLPGVMGFLVVVSGED